MTACWRTMNVKCYKELSKEERIKYGFVKIDKEALKKVLDRERNQIKPQKVTPTNE